jgi:hypothetical protein
VTESFAPESSLIHDFDAIATARSPACAGAALAKPEGKYHALDERSGPLHRAQRPRIDDASGAILFQGRIVDPR